MRWGWKYILNDKNKNTKYIPVLINPSHFNVQPTLFKTSCGWAHSFQSWPMLNWSIHQLCRSRLTQASPKTCISKDSPFGDCRQAVPYTRKVPTHSFWLQSVWLVFLRSGMAIFGNFPTTKYGRFCIIPPCHVCGVTVLKCWAHCWPQET